MVNSNNRELPHQLISASMNWSAVGVAIWLVPFIASYQSWLAGLGALIGILCAAPVMASWRPDPRILGAAWFSCYHTNQINDALQHELCSSAREVRSFSLPLFATVIAVMVIVTALRYPHSLTFGTSDILVLLLYAAGGSFGGTIALNVSLLYYALYKHLKFSTGNSPTR
jgi:hypothetical protein